MNRQLKIFLCLSAKFWSNQQPSKHISYIHGYVADIFSIIISNMVYQRNFGPDQDSRGRWWFRFFNFLFSSLENCFVWYKLYPEISAPTKALEVARRTSATTSRMGTRPSLRGLQRSMPARMSRNLGALVWILNRTLNRNCVCVRNPTRDTELLQSSLS